MTGAEFQPLVAAASQSWQSLLIFFLFILLSAISNWLKKKGPPDPSDPFPQLPEAPEPPATLPLPRRTRGLQPQPLPSVQPRQPHPQSPPSSRTPPKRDRPLPIKPVAMPARQPASVEARVPAIARQPSPAAAPSPLRDSLSRYDNAGQLSSRIAERLQKLDREVAKARPVPVAARVSRSAAMPTIDSKNAAFWRQALVSSILLGPPCGLADRVPELGN